MTEEIKEVIKRRGIGVVLTDSRWAVDADKAIFFALRTATNDGHHFIPELLQRGVKAFVVEDLPDDYKALDADFIKVDDTLAALQSLAADHRDTALKDCRVVAVTGSRGKTLVKEWLAEALSAKGPTGRSPRSYNSRIGVPLSLMGIPAPTQYAVVEAGVSQQGEMEPLRRMIKPEVVVITTIDDTEHREGFESFEAKCAEKLSLAKDARVIVYPEELETQVMAYVPAKVLKVAVSMPPDADWMERDRLICTEALRTLGATLPDGTVRPLQTRLDVSDAVNGCVTVADRFTCDLFSLPSALDFARRRRTAGRSFTLMLDELRGEQDYAKLARLLQQWGVERFIGVGPGYVEHASELPAGSRLFASGAEMLAQLTVADFSNELILAKGEEGSAVAAMAEQLQARHHETVLEVNLDAIVHNFNIFRAMLKPGTGMVAMVKASGYGAGAYELAKTLQSQGASYLAVAVVDEGEELRRAGITMPIMALNPKVTNYDSLFANRLEPEVFSFGMLDEIVREGAKRGVKDYPIHVKFDTGMHRLGFLKEEIPPLCEALKSTGVVKVRSVFSHLATADCLDMDSYTLEQLNLFTDICEEMRQRLGYSFLRHILNSAGIARFPGWQFELVRLGIGLYGIDTLGIPETAGLRTVSTLRSLIISIKHWPAGTAIGYGRRTILKRDSVVATVPVGYADGLDRHLSNGRGEVIVRGHRCPIVGNICMDACMVDVTDAPGAQVGDSVEFFGENLPVDDVAAKLDTIPYEVLTSVSPRVKRVYYRE